MRYIAHPTATEIRSSAQPAARNENTPVQTVSHTYDHGLAIWRPLDTKNANGGMKKNSASSDVPAPTKPACTDVGVRLPSISRRPVIAPAKPKARAVAVRGFVLT